MKKTGGCDIPFLDIQLFDNLEKRVDKPMKINTKYTLFIYERSYLRLTVEFRLDSFLNCEILNIDSNYLERSHYRYIGYIGIHCIAKWVKDMDFRYLYLIPIGSGDDYYKLYDYYYKIGFYCVPLRRIRYDEALISIYRNSTRNNYLRKNGPSYRNRTRKNGAKNFYENCATMIADVNDVIEKTRKYF